MEVLCATVLLVTVLLVWYKLYTKKTTYFVSIEGNIGIGKSTVLKSLKKHGMNVVPEPVELWTNFEGINFLELYSSNLAKWAFTFQTMVLFTMWTNQAKAASKKDKIIVVERSLHSVVKLFSTLQLKQNLISQEQFTLIKTMAEKFMNLFQRKQVFIYLRGMPETAFKRSTKRGRTEESTLPLEYFQNLHQGMEDWMAAQTDVIAVIDASQSPENILDMVLRAVQQLK